MLRGIWPGKLVKQYGRFQLYTTVVMTPEGVLTGSRRYKILVDNAPNETIALDSVEDAHSDREGFIHHVREWQRAQEIYIARVETHLATLVDKSQVQEQQQYLSSLKSRYQIVEQALVELEAVPPS